mmetsp:Transcript_10935/g.33532  ORF Transcript_10935/g.33532 Transcript_10935/m.33532 type:complete len:363 (+) Transcript_10935:365-1453(+)
MAAAGFVGACAVRALGAASQRRGLASGEVSRRVNPWMGLGDRRGGRREDDRRGRRDGGGQQGRGSWDERWSDRGARSQPRRSGGRQRDQFNAPKAFRSPREEHEEERELSDIQLSLRSGHDLLFGANPVLAALQSRRRSEMYALWIVSSATSRDRPEIVEVVERAKRLDIPVKEASKGDLNSLCDNRPHQGVILEASPLSFEPLSSLPATDQNEVWLVLDEVTDPMNFGALARSALFLRSSGLAVAEKNCCPMTPTASKASSGALEQMPVHAVRNLPQFLQKCADNGWRVLGASMDTKAVPLKELSLDRPTLIVLGSEGFGLRTNVSNACTEHVKIGAGGVGTVDSLNVSVAGAVLLHHFLG